MITLGVPTNRNVRPKTAESLLRLVSESKHDFHIVVAEEGYTIAENRHYIAVQAVNNGSAYLFFVDDDMTFEPDYLDKLLEHDKDIVGGVYSSRKEGSPRMVYTTDDKIIDLNKQSLTELTKVKAKGTALMLINTRVFTMPRPWFEFEYDENGMCTLGEDWFFCKKAGEHGYETWVDPTLTNGHLAEICL